MAGDPRRRLLRRTDDLLEGVEQLRMRGLRLVPERLRAQVAEVASELGRSEPRASMSVAATHDYLLRLQQFLLRSGSPAQATRRVPLAGDPAPIPDLALPARGAADEAGWRERVRLTLERARDLAHYLDSQARAASRLPGPEARALAAERSDQAERAWRVNERLAVEAERILDRAPVLDPLPALPSTGRIEFEDLVIDLDFEGVLQSGRLVRLTTVERSILTVLVANSGRVVSREAMLHLVYGDDPTVNVRSRGPDVHIYHLREKLGNPPYLETVAGAGYRASVRSGSGDDAESIRERRREQRRAWAQGASPSTAPTTATRPSRRQTGR